jgi:hypothetical protein
LDDGRFLCDYWFHNVPTVIAFWTNATSLGFKSRRARGGRPRW